MKQLLGLTRSRIGAINKFLWFLCEQSKFKRVPVLVRGGFYGKGKTGDANRIRLRDAAARALETASCRMVPVYADPALNERCYGDLQVDFGTHPMPLYIIKTKEQFREKLI